MIQKCLWKKINIINWRLKRNTTSDSCRTSMDLINQWSARIKEQLCTLWLGRTGSVPVWAQIISFTYFLLLFFFQKESKPPYLLSVRISYSGSKLCHLNQISIPASIWIFQSFHGDLTTQWMLLAAAHRLCWFTVYISEINLTLW